MSFQRTACLHMYTQIVYQKLLASQKSAGTAADETTLCAKITLDCTIAAIDHTISDILKTFYYVYSLTIYPQLRGNIRHL